MSIGISYIVRAPRHYAPYLLEGRRDYSIRQYAAEAFARNLVGQGRVVTEIVNGDTPWADYTAVQVA